MAGQGAGSRLDAKERRRRAAIARRYVAIGSPTRADDEAYARELGLSVDSLWRLARTWRLAADTAERPEADPIAARARALEAARDPDLSHVSPSRRPLVRERLRVIAEHLAKEHPTGADVDEAAATLGMTAHSFRRLLRGWIQHRNAALLPGGSAAIRNSRYERKDVGAREPHFARALETLGTQVSSMALHREVVRLCEADGVRPPCQPTTYNRLMRARSEAPTSEGWSGFGLDHSAIALAVATEGGRAPTLAVLGMVFAMTSGRIVAHTLSPDPPTPRRTAELLRRALAELPPGGEPLTLCVSADPGWEELREVLRAAAVETVSGERRPGSTGRPLASRLATRRFGDLIGALRLRPRQTRDPANAAMTRVMGSEAPLTLADATAAVDDVIRLHNEGRQATVDGFVPLGGAAGLATALDHLARQAG